MSTVSTAVYFNRVQKPYIGVYGSSSVRSLAEFVRASDTCVVHRDMGEVLPLEASLHTVDSNWTGSLVASEGTEPMENSPSMTDSSSQSDALFTPTTEQELSLWDSDVRDADLARLASCPDVKVLDLGRTPLTDEGVSHIVQLTTLKTLVLYKTKITGVGVKELARLRELTILDLESTSVDDSGVGQLTQLTHLIGLNLAFSRVKNVTYLSSFSELLDLNLSKTGTTLNGVRALSTLQKLTSLNLSKTKLKSDWLKHLTHFSKLRELNMGCTRIQDESLESLCHLQGLKRLLLFNTAISNDGIRALVSTGPGIRFNLLPETDKKTLETTCIVSFGVDPQDKCPLTSLQELDLSGCRICDRGLEWMTAFTNLTALDLAYNAITDAGFEVLKSIKSVTELNLVGNCLSEASLATSEMQPRSRNQSTLTALNYSPMSTQPLQDDYWRGGGLFSCTADCGVCLKTCCLPCITYGETREALHGGEVPPTCCKPACCCCLVSILSLTLCTWAYTMGTRRDIRMKYKLNAEPCADCLVHLCCLPLALCQERRELKNRPLTTWPVSDTQE